MSAIEGVDNLDVDSPDELPLKCLEVRSRQHSVPFPAIVLIRLITCRDCTRLGLKRITLDLTYGRVVSL